MLLIPFGSVLVEDLEVGLRRSARRAAADIRRRDEAHGGRRWKVERRAAVRLDRLQRNVEAGRARFRVSPALEEDRFGLLGPAEIGAELGRAVLSGPSAGASPLVVLGRDSGKLPFFSRLNLWHASRFLGSTLDYHVAFTGIPLELEHHAP